MKVYVNGVAYEASSIAIKGSQVASSHVVDDADLTIDVGTNAVSVTEDDGAHSFQILAPDLTIEADAGSDDNGNPKFLAAAMGNIFGDALTKVGNYLAGLIGMYSVTGSGATAWPNGAVLGGIADGSTDADGAFVAWIDGDSLQTNATAAFKVQNRRNSVPGSGFNYGFDSHSPSEGGYAASVPLKADIRMSNEVVFMNGAGAPSNGTTGADFAGPGSLYVDVTNKKLYINTNTKASPTWTVVGTQS